MLGGYLPVLVMLIAATVIAIVMVVASFLLGPKKPNKYKADTYESGMKPVGSARERFPIQFYLIAMLYIIFDIETIFLYPWAVIYNDTSIVAGRAVKLFLLSEMAIFVIILFVGYFYIVGKGALSWSSDEQKREREGDSRVYAPRPPIRFGNENSGPVALTVRQEAPNIGRPESAEEEGRRAPVPFGGGKR